MDIVIAQFTKTPIPGQVKTRLTPFLTDQQACDVHQKLVAHVAQSVHIDGVTNELWSNQGGAFVEGLAARLGYIHHLQQGDDLGQRLAHTVRSVLTRASALCIVGSDCPYFTQHYLRDAFTRLSKPNIDLVIGPAKDGGYVFIALKHDYAALFEGIPWGTERVFDQTMMAADSLELSVEVLEPLGDIDRPEDYRELVSNDQYSHLRVQ